LWWHRQIADKTYDLLVHGGGNGKECKKSRRRVNDLFKGMRSCAPDAFDNPDEAAVDRHLVSELGIGQALRRRNFDDIADPGDSQYVGNVNRGAKLSRSPGMLIRMRAAVIERYGEPPVLRDVPEPKAEGASLVEVTAAPLNPVDISIASGKFYAGSPPTPYVAGGEGIGRLRQGGNAGPRVYFRAAMPNGAMAERALVSRGETVPLPDTIPDAVAAALGTPGIAAYLGLTRRAEMKPGETVLVLGASGVLGSIAVQVARLLGAGRVIAAARNEQGLARAKELGADATVDLKQTEGLTDRIKEATNGQLHIVIDPIWGAPAVAAMDAMSLYGRFIQLGQSASPEATLTSRTVRGRYLSVLGYGSFFVPWVDQAVAYRRLVEYASSGKLKVETEVLPLEAAAVAWKQQASSPHRKLVLSPQAGR